MRRRRTSSAPYTRRRSPIGMASPAAKARASIRRSRAGLLAKTVFSGIPAAPRRAPPWAQAPADGGHDRSARGRVGWRRRENPDPAILDPPRGARVLSLHLDRFRPFLEKESLPSGLRYQSDFCSTPGNISYHVQNGLLHVSSVNRIRRALPEKDTPMNSAHRIPR